MARSGDNHMKLQLHKTSFSGKGDVRLTNPAFNHTTYISPDYKYFVDIAQTHNTPPVVSLMDKKGKEVVPSAPKAKKDKLNKKADKKKETKESKNKKDKKSFWDWFKRKDKKKTKKTTSQ